MIKFEQPEDRAAAAGEYVLGTLGADDHAAVEQALPHDTHLRADVYEWQDRLLGLSLRAVAVLPRAQLWQRIDVAVSALAAAPAAPRHPVAAPTVPWWHRLGLWQGLSGLALAACLAMSVMLFDRADIALTGPRYVAVLQSPQDQSSGWVVEVQAGAMLKLRPVSDTGEVPRGKSLQFWTKMQGAAGPTSLGLVRAGQPLEIPVSRLPGVGNQQLFEITLEPENGSPIGRPTGPILYVGRTVQL